jgi:pimeloyl-ACP methyl ester carboxylesterase
MKTLNTLSLALGLAAAGTGLAMAADAAPPEKMWLGEFTINGRATPIIVHDRSATPGAPSDVDVPSMMARGVPLTKFAMTPKGGSFELQGGPDLFKFDGKRVGGQFKGNVVQGAAKGSFTLVAASANDPVANARMAGSYQIAPGHVIDIGIMDEFGAMPVFLDQKTLRQGPLYMLAPGKYVSGPNIGTPYPFVVQADFVKDAKGAITGMRWRDGKAQVTAKRVAAHRVEEVTVVNGDVTLKGSLTLPQGPGPHPAVVFAHGSGASTRNVGVWNMFFVRQGFAVLSLDKRGAGESTGDWTHAGIEDIAGDWLAGVDYLKTRADIDNRRIGVHGSSQGGWTGPLMASRSDDIAFVIVRAGSAVPVGATMAYEIGWSAREQGMSEADAQAAAAGSQAIFDGAGKGWDAYQATSAPYRDKPYAKAMWSLNWSKDGWGMPWAAKNAPYDPAAALSKVKVPVLWFMGELDHNVPVEPTIAALEKLRKPNFTVVRLPGTGHSFTQSRTGNNMDVVNESHMTAGYFEKMENWLASQGFSKR